MDTQAQDDKTLLTDRLREARGKVWVRLYHEVYDRIGADMQAEARATIERTGAFTLVDAGVLALRYNLPFKATLDFLRTPGPLPLGTYERFADSRLKVRDVLEAARARGVVERERAV
ncbi:MAG TPA: hypothetical protein VD948_11850 [Rhodothermales bacterium]|nr:hypothetical protein [Rhodothermales bacterium]